MRVRPPDLVIMRVRLPDGVIRMLLTRRIAVGGPSGRDGSDSSCPDSLGPEVTLEEALEGIQRYVTIFVPYFFELIPVKGFSTDRV